MRYLLFILVFTYLVSLSASVDGIYEISVLDLEGKELSVATAFILEYEDSNIVVTSYHLLDEYILQASKLVLDIGYKDIELRILGVDDLHDILVLTAKDSTVLDDLDSFKLKNTCKKSVNVIGFRKGRQFLVPASLSMSRLRGFLKLDSFLPKGFSGSPILDISGEMLCGMVILSNKEDVTSIGVSASYIARALNELNTAMTIAQYRISAGFEFIVHNNAELKNILKELDGREAIINIVSGKNFFVRNAHNVILNVLAGMIGRLVIINSNNIYVNGFSGRGVYVKDSIAISIVNSRFSNKKYGVVLDNSKDILISNNIFVSLTNGIVLKGLDDDALNTIYLARNRYKNVRNKILRAG